MKLRLSLLNEASLRQHNQVSLKVTRKLNEETRNSNLDFGITDLHNVEYISINPD